jgi:hypothetical protein
MLHFLSVSYSSLVENPALQFHVNLRSSSVRFSMTDSVSGYGLGLVSHRRLGYDLLTV